MGASGLIVGNAQQVVIQAVGALATLIYAFVTTLVIAKVVEATVGLRVDAQEEYVGLDLSQHGEVAYT